MFYYLRIIANGGTRGQCVEDQFQILCPMTKPSIALLVPLTFWNLKLSQLTKQHAEHYFEAG